jgi:hypothetical protein
MQAQKLAVSPGITAEYNQFTAIEYAHTYHQPDQNYELHSGRKGKNGRNGQRIWQIRKPEDLNLIKARRSNAGRGIDLNQSQRNDHHKNA